jgi:hypothetical protein
LTAIQISSISGLSENYTKDGVTVEVHLVRLEQEATWTLEVVNSAGTSIVWDDPFQSDEQAYAEFLRTVAEERMKAFTDEEKLTNVIPFRRLH